MMKVETKRKKRNETTGGRERRGVKRDDEGWKGKKEEK